MFVERKTDANSLLSLIEHFPVTLLTGPRQCGKTTLAKSLEPTSYYLLSDPQEAESFVNFCKTQPKTTRIVAVDEIQNRPDVLPLIRQWVDTRPDTKLLVLGSATFMIDAELPRHLLGRMAVYQLGGFTLEDVGVENLVRHWCRGGFPQSYLAPDEETSFSWRQEYIAGYPYAVILRESAGVSPHVMDSLIRSLPRYSSGLVNFSSISRALAVSRGTVQRYLQLLAVSGLVRSLNPFAKPADTMLRKTPKLYVRDSGLLACLADVRSEKTLEDHELAPLIWEAYVMELLAISLGRRRAKLSYWRDRTGAELDAVWAEEDLRVGAEVKFSPRPRISKTMKKAIDTLHLSHLWVLHRGKETFRLAKHITAVPATQFLSDQQGSVPSFATPSQLARSSARQKRVFVSYCHNDDEFVKQLIDALESEAINVTIDFKTLRLGGSIEEFIKKAVRTTEWTILVVSENSIRSPWVMAEFLETVLYERFIEQCRLIPICVDKSVFDPDLPIAIDKELDSKIAEVDERIRKALDRKMGLDPFGGVRERLRNLQFNVGKAVERLTSVLMGDFSYSSHFEQEIQRIVRVLQTGTIE